VRRAHASGSLREDFTPQDIPLVNMMLGAILDASQAVLPELWRRYLALVLDGMRADRAHQPLPVGPVDLDQLDGVMRAWCPPHPRP
jgi:hypothetical protein